MSDSSSLKPKFEFTGKHMLVLMLLFFGVIIAVNLFMATLASKSWTGLVVKNSYVASQNFNDALQNAAEQKSRGWNSSLNYTAGTLVFTLRDSSGKVLAVDKIRAEIGRPAFEQKDQSIQFIPLATGANKIAIRLASGIWAIKIIGKVAGKDYRRDVRLNVDRGGKGTLL